MEIAMFVISIPTRTSPTRTKAPAMRNAQWLPVHFATQVEKWLKKVWILRSSSSSAIHVEI
jgi:hypothetical protein